MNNLPTDLLRTFVTVIELGGITAAGNTIQRSQPAVTLQIQRLEALIGKPLLQRHGRTVTATADGQILLRYAREMLALNDAAIARLTRQPLEGTIRLGIPNEFASSFLPEILGKFAQRHPDLAIEVKCALSTELLSAYRNRALDLVFALHAQAPDPSAASWTESIAWVTSPQHRPYLRRPLPLIVAPEGCVYRQRIEDVLQAERIPSRVLYSSPSFGGIRAGVAAGLGVTVLAESIIPTELIRLNDSRRLPPLAPVHVQIHHDPEGRSSAVRALARYMAEHLASRRPAATQPAE